MNWYQRLIGHHGTDRYVCVACARRVRRIRNNRSARTCTGRCPEHGRVEAWLS